MENSEDNTGQQKLSGMNYGGDSNISPDLWVLESLHVNCFLRLGSDAFLLLKRSASSCFRDTVLLSRPWRRVQAEQEVAWGAGAAAALFPARGGRADWAPSLQPGPLVLLGLLKFRASPHSTSSPPQYTE